MVLHGGGRRLVRYPSTLQSISRTKAAWSYSFDGKVGTGMYAPGKPKKDSSKHQSGSIVQDAAT
jgi:hypothetical protein